MNIIGEVIDVIKKSKLFDERWYIDNHKDVALMKMDAAEHYVRLGARINRDPSPQFSTQAYLKAYPDVVDTALNPLYHFLKWGQKEGRVSSPSAYADLTLNDTQDVGTASKKTSVAVQPKKPPTIAEDLAKKLWGGFSLQALADIDKYLNSDASSAEKTQCLWNVTRFFAAERNWEQAYNFLKKIRKYDKKFINQKRPRLLEAEITAHLGNFEKSESLISYPINNGSTDGDYHCAMSNLIGLQVQANQFSGTDPDAKRMEWINHIYSRHGLSHIELIDAAKGLVFGNITSKAPVLTSSETKSLKISILMPVYNAEDFIETSVKSMLAQTWGNVELVAVDDRSTDNSWEILQRLAQSDSRLTCYRNEQNMGAYPTRNFALSKATGDIITVHDSDDWSHPQMLETQLKAMLDNPEIKASFSSMTRVFPNMIFSLRPERNNMEYIHRSYPSLMIRRSDLNMLSRWDPVVANADDEFVQRARGLWGKEALRDVLPDVPFSYFLKHEASLTSQKSTNLRSLTYGVRHEYSKQADFWRTHVLEPAQAEGRTVEINRTDRKRPFPIPNILVPKPWKGSSKYDVIIISDLTLLGGTRRCNEGYIAAALKLGMRVGLFHWPRYDLRLIDDIGKEYRELSYNENVDILTCEEEISCDLLLIHHPPILKYVPDVLPKISADHVAVLVNQLPKQLLSEGVKYYLEDDVVETCKQIFGKAPTWIPISPLVRKHLTQLGYKNLAQSDWVPPLGRALPAKPVARSTNSSRLPVIGRHSRDHWTKWPENDEKLVNSYCGNTSYAVRFMGGVAAADKIVKKWPANWESLPFDSISVSDFLGQLDFFLHFTNSDYIEEFGRNIMEAMAHGVPVILPRQFKEVFGDAAVYADPEQVQSVIESLWSDSRAYADMSLRGYSYVKKWSEPEQVKERIKKAVSGSF